jgi:hypothetical protein
MSFELVPRQCAGFSRRRGRVDRIKSHHDRHRSESTPWRDRMSPGLDVREADGLAASGQSL